MSKKLSRRHFLRSTAVAGAGLAAVLAGCKPKIVEIEKEVTKVVEKVVKETVVVAGTPQVVEKVVKETVVVEKVVEKEAPKPVTKGGTFSLLWWGGQVAPGKPDYFGDSLTMYKQAQPEIDIEVSSVPWESVSDWIRTNQAAGTLTDVVMWYMNPTTEQEVTGTSPWLAFDPFLNLPSSYSKSAAWRDDINEKLIGSSFYKGLQNQYGIPISYGCSGWAYNKKIFKDAGLDPETPPETWADLVDTCEVLKKNADNLGIDAPMANAVVVERQGGSLDWPIRLLFDVVAFQPWNKITGGADRFPTHEERLQAFYDGTASYCTEETEQMWNMVKQLVSYWPEGAMGMSYADQLPFFLQGKAAMLMVWMGGLRQLDEAVNEGTIDWEYGAFGWPTVTAESNPFPMDKLNPIDGGWNGWWTIPTDRKSTKELELVVDFLQWWTSEDFSAWWATKNYALPANIHAQGNPKCMAFYKGDPHERRGLMYLDKFKWFGYFQSWLLDDIGYEEYCHSVDEANKMEAERLAGEIGLALSNSSPWD